MKRLVPSCLLTILVCLPARATLVLFTDGSNMHAVSYQAVDSGTMKLSVEGGAAVFVPMHRIERILDDTMPSPELEAAMAKVVFDRTSPVPHSSWHYSPARGPLYRTRFDATILEAARRFDVDAALISAIIKAESDFNPREVSAKGACGLMQLMPATAKRFGVADSFDPAANIMAGTKYLRWLLDTFHGRTELALAAYNAGEGNVWKYNGVPPFRETVEYIRRIANNIAMAVESPRHAPARR